MEIQRQVSFTQQQNYGERRVEFEKGPVGAEATIYLSPTSHEFQLETQFPAPIINKTIN